MSPALLAEVADVLSRPRIRKRLSAEDAQLFLADIAAQAVIFADPADPPSVCRDPDDDYLVALAGIAHAEALVSGDDDLLAVKPGQRGVGGTNASPVAHDPKNDETPVNTGVLKYRYRDSKPASEE